MSYSTKSTPLRSWFMIWPVFGHIFEIPLKNQEQTVQRNSFCSFKLIRNPSPSSLAFFYTSLPTKSTRNLSKLIIYLDFWKCYEDDLFIYSDVFTGAGLIRISFMTQGGIGTVSKILANSLPKSDFSEYFFIQFFRQNVTILANRKLLCLWYLIHTCV